LFEKTRSLNSIVSFNLNVHQFYIPKLYTEYRSLVNKLGLCTLRTDHASLLEDLPFYIVDAHKDSSEKLDAIWANAQDRGYRFIISDGIKYDAIQEYNMVVKFQEDGHFLFEASGLKVPLRHMYRYPTSLLSCTGTLSEGIHLWYMFNVQYGLNRLVIKNDLLTLYNYGLFDKWLEVTKYPIPVGIRNENIVFWQIK